MVMGSSVIGALGASPGAGTFVSVPPPTGVAATDTANIAAALAAVATAGGTVQLQAGNYAVSSSARVDTGVTYHSTTSGNYPANSWADASITAADVGKYVIGGALGNFIDRLVYGTVADFFHFYGLGYDWYVFNVADAAITFGVIGLLYDALMKPETPQGEAGKE